MFDKVNFFDNVLPTLLYIIPLIIPMFAPLVIPELVALTAQNVGTKIPASYPDYYFIIQ